MISITALWVCCVYIESEMHGLPPIQARPRAGVGYVIRSQNVFKSARICQLWIDLRLVFFIRLGYLSAMINETVEMLARKLAESVPPGLRSVREELEQNFRSVLKAGLGKMDLVTREEFEVQEAVLARTRSKLNGLENRLESLEKAPSRETSAKASSATKKSSKKKTAKKKPAKKTAKKKSG